MNKFKLKRMSVYSYGKEYKGTLEFAIGEKMELKIEITDETVAKLIEIMLPTFEKEANLKFEDVKQDVKEYLEEKK